MNIFWCIYSIVLDPLIQKTYNCVVSELYILNTYDFQSNDPVIATNKEFCHISLFGRIFICSIDFPERYPICLFFPNDAILGLIEG